MSAEFSVEYDLVVAAANTYAQSSEEFKSIIAILIGLATQLSQTSLVGQSGQAAAKALEQLQARLQALIAFSDELRADLLATVGDVRDDVDPGMASRFTS